MLLEGFEPSCLATPPPQSGESSLFLHKSLVVYFLQNQFLFGLSMFVPKLTLDVFPKVFPPFRSADQHSFLDCCHSCLLVPTEGVEPSWPCGRWILSPVRLPIPPRGPTQTVIHRSRVVKGYPTQILQYQERPDHVNPYANVPVRPHRYLADHLTTPQTSM